MSVVTDLNLDPSPLGAFELFFLRREKDLVAYLVQHIELVDLFVIGKLNTRLRDWFSAQCQRTWDFVKFARLFVHRPRMLFSMLNLKHTLMYGEGVLQFFLRNASIDTTLHLNICTTMEKFSDIQKFLYGEGYICLALQPVLEYWPADLYLGDLIQKRYQRDAVTWSLNSERSTSHEDLEGIPYSFHKGPLARRRTVTVHLIRCEPHRHVLSQSNSTSDLFVT